ncbi:MAG: YihY/virulence factor BrkB family protein [Hyphomonadaceae bacterium]|nr:YihY/virulence factor BrkB family protein [Hyphomonadaceae bacterium]
MSETAKAKWTLPGAWLWRPIWRAFLRLSRPQVRVVSGGIAFYALFSIFPLIYLTLTLLIAVLPAEISSQIAGSIEQLLAANVAPLDADEVDIISSLTPQGLTFRALIAIIIVGITATSGAKAVITGIRMIADVDRRRGLIAFQGASLIMTAALILLVWTLGAAQLIVTIFQQGEAGSAGRFAGQVAALASTLWITKWVASFAVFYLLTALSLRGCGLSGRALAGGSATGALAWLGLTWAFQLYLSLSVLDTLYGALASVILGFIWLTLSVMALLFGAALAVEWTHAYVRDAPASK